MVRRLQHGGSVHFVIDQPDGTRGLLPAWMTDPRAGQLATTEVPLLALEALRALRGVITGALLSLSTLTTMREGSNDERASPMPAAGSTHARGAGARTGSNPTGDPDGSDAVAETADDRVRYHAGTAGRGRR